MSTDSSGRPPTGTERIANAVREPGVSGHPALVAFVTAGYPTREGFGQLLLEVAREADVVEIGVPFTDPMADGVTIQRASRTALDNGVSLSWILDTLEGLDRPPQAPLVLMSYLNPLLSFGFDRLATRCRAAGVAGFIVPDLPLEESEPVRAAVEPEGLALIQLVTPVTAPERLDRLCAASTGFVYAVTVTGITGGRVDLPPAAVDYLDRVRRQSDVPVCAGFGIREAAQVRAIRSHADGVIVGSALIEVLEAGEDPAAFLRGLRA